MRLRKDGTQRLKDGKLPANPNRLGPLTIEARKYGLAKVLEIQKRVNKEARIQGRPQISLINEEEHNRILELIDQKTWPLGWAGTEITGDAIINQVVTKNLSQYTLFENE